MTRRRNLLSVLGVALSVVVVTELALVSASSAQTFTRRSVPVGEVTGLEMGIDGSLSATPGDRVRWFVTLYEVLRRRDLRPSPNSTLEVTASFAPDGPVATLVTDARGRANIEIPIPLDVPTTEMEIRVTAISPRHVRRVFSVGLSTTPSHELAVFVDRDDPAPGSTVAVFGRVLDRVTGRPVPRAEVTLSAAGNAPLMAPRTLVTDASGVFSSNVDVGEAPGAIRITASTDHGRAVVTPTVNAEAPPALWVVAEPAVPVAAPNDTVDVRVRVRRADGRPVRGARVSFADTPEDPDDPETRAPRTDARGRATLAWRVTSTSDAPYEEQSRALRVVDPAVTTIDVPVRLRVARARVLSTFSVEGGALVPGLEGRVHVRLVTPDGRPAAGREVQLDAARLGGVLRATSDADGVATFDGRVVPNTTTDACGGPTTTEATLIVGAERKRLCVPVDPDATVALRIDDIRVAESFDVHVERRAEVRSAPIEVMALVRRDDAWTPVAVVVVPASEDHVTLTPAVPEHREIWLRARPLLPDARAARGGSLVVWRGALGSGLRLDADTNTARVSGAGEDTVAVYAVRAQRETSIEAAVKTLAGPVAMGVSRERSAGYLRALLASRTPEDTAATAVLREREVVAQPLPAEPVAEGLLRDPWRTRARFVRGRLGRLMRAVEDYADAQVPDHLEDVAVRVNGRFRFNQAMLIAAANHAGLAEEMVAALDGEPLDINGLTQMDAAFTFDNVARRITRERLFRVLVMLREHVRHHGLDLPWARRGDPAEYLVTLLEGGEFSNEYPERAHLFDGWGTPLALRRASSGRARFAFLEPVPGWELVSAGPDGRFGNADDVVDPFARVLASSGIYAEAVGEDILLARLNGVVLGRATVESLGALFAVEVAIDDSTGVTRAADTWGMLPAPVTTSSEEARLAPIMAPIGGVGDGRTWALPPERRQYAAVGVRFGRDGSLETTRTELEAGLPWGVRLTLPTAMRTGEQLHVPITLIKLAEAPEPSIEVDARGGAVTARLVDGALALTATRPGMTRLVVRVRVGDTEIESFSERVRVVPRGSLRARHSGTVTHGADATELRVEVPDGATPWRAQLVLGAPRALHRDPLFAAFAERHPAVTAWAEQQHDGAVDGERVAALTRAYRSGDGGDPLSIAAALTVWAGQSDPTQTPLLEATTTLTEGLGGAGATPVDPQLDWQGLATRASVLAALSSAVVSGAPSQQSSDALATLLARIRLEGWRTLATAPDHPTVMARMAAALLLADRRDVPGRALLARAREALEEDRFGRRWVPGDEGRVEDGFIGTLALAVAARQVEDDALADELARNVVGRLYLVERGTVECAFWALAASVYGVFGVDAPTRVDVEIDGHVRAVDLEHGAAVLSLAPGAVAKVTTDLPVWVRAESRYLVPDEATDEGALSARIEGSAGGLGERAAFELVVENVGDQPAGSPTIEITLPGAAQLDDATRAAIEGTTGVVHLDSPDDAGVVRIRFAGLGAGAAHRVPFPLLWIARGRTRGLSTRTFDASTPWQIRTTRDRILTISGARP